MCSIPLFFISFFTCFSFHHVPLPLLTYSPFSLYSPTPPLSYAPPHSPLPPIPPPPLFYPHLAYLILFLSPTLFLPSALLVQSLPTHQLTFIFHTLPLTSPRLPSPSLASPLLPSITLFLSCFPSFRTLTRSYTPSLLALS